ncbi:MAG: hypothetical protein ACTHKB_13080, partial [Burkholderiaceae bacterium]
MFFSINEWVPAFAGVTLQGYQTKTERERFSGEAESEHKAVSLRKKAKPAGQQGAKAQPADD